MKTRSACVFVVLHIVLSWLTSLSAQYNYVKCQSSPWCLRIVQIDQMESSTLVFMQYVSAVDDGICNINENTFARVAGEDKKYHLVNSINMPICTEAVKRWTVLDKEGQKHNFVLEFEKIPDGKLFDIIEDVGNPEAFNIYGINMNVTYKGRLRNIRNFISTTPVKEFGLWVQNDVSMAYTVLNNIEVIISAQKIRLYGKYYAVNVNIRNNSGKSIYFDINNVEAVGFKKVKNKPDKIKPMVILSASEYDKKVSRIQTIENILVAYAEGSAAARAGYSTVTTTYKGSSHTSSSASIDVYAGGSYGYADVYGDSYTTTYGKSQTVVYNAAAAYAAQQQASANIQRYVNQQEETRKQLNDGYIKNNVIQDNVDYSGFFNIKYKRIDILKLSFVINGERYLLYY